MYRTLEPIEYELYNVGNVRIFDRNIIVRGDVYYGRMNLLKLPHFKYVGGDLYCFDNQLTSLEGCATYIGSNLKCYNNKVKLSRPKRVKIRGGFMNS